MHNNQKSLTLKSLSLFTPIQPLLQALVRNLIQFKHQMNGDLLNQLLESNFTHTLVEALVKTNQGGNEMAKLN
jgi:hypothetical protein